MTGQSSEDRDDALFEMQRRLAASELAFATEKYADAKAQSLFRHKIRRLFGRLPRMFRSEEHTSELQSLMRISYAVFCLKKKKKLQKIIYHTTTDSQVIKKQHVPLYKNIYKT